MLKSVVAVSTAAIALGLVACAGKPAMLEKPDANNPCSSINWNAQFLAKYPRAPVACRDVDVVNGVSHARFDALVTQKSSDAIVFDFLNVAGGSTGEISVKPGPNATVKLGDKIVPMKDLKKGDQVTVWVPTNGLGVLTNPAEAATSSVIVN